MQNILTHCSRLYSPLAAMRSLPTKLPSASGLGKAISSAAASSTLFLRNRVTLVLAGATLLFLGGFAFYRWQRSAAAAPSATGAADPQVDSPKVSSETGAAAPQVDSAKVSSEIGAAVAQVDSAKVISETERELASLQGRFDKIMHAVAAVNSSTNALPSSADVENSLRGEDPSREPPLDGSVPEERALLDGAMNKPPEEIPVLLERELLTVLSEFRSLRADLRRSLNYSHPLPKRLHALLERVKGISQDLSLAAPGATLTGTSRVPQGIVNSGNSCFIASVLQLLRVGYQEHIDAKAQSGNQIARILSELFQILESDSPIAREITRSVHEQFFSKNYTEYREGTQGCAIELLDRLLAVLDVSQVPIQRGVQSLEDSLLLEGEAPADVLPEGQNSSSLSPYLSLPVIKNGVPITTLNEALKFSSKDPHCFPNGVHYVSGRQEKFSQNAQRIEILDNVDFPYVFPLVLNRKIVEDSGQCAKLDHQLQVNEVWVIPPDCVTANQLLVYQLVGFIHHKGSGEEGHYMSCILQEGTWHLANDSVISPLGTPEFSEQRFQQLKNSASVYLFRAIK